MTTASCKCSGALVRPEKHPHLMTDEELGWAMANLPWWQWMPGMRNANAGKGGRVHDTEQSAEGLAVWSFRDRGDGFWHEYADNSFPDINDPATVGCIIHLMGDHWVLRHNPLTTGPNEWMMNCIMCGSKGVGPSRGVAVARAALLPHYRRSRAS
jgi:hypothetical protein